MYMYIYIYIHTYAYVYVYIYIYMHVYTHRDIQQQYACNIDDLLRLLEAALAHGSPSYIHAHRTFGYIPVNEYDLSQGIFLPDLLRLLEAALALGGAPARRRLPQGISADTLAPLGRWRSSTRSSTQKTEDGEGFFDLRGVVLSLLVLLLLLLLSVCVLSSVVVVLIIRIVITTLVIIISIIISITIIIIIIISSSIVNDVISTNLIVINSPTASFTDRTGIPGHQPEK